MFRLLFKVSYTADGVGDQVEEILSRPFLVYSNKKKNTRGTALYSGI